MVSSARSIAWVGIGLLLVAACSGSDALVSGPRPTPPGGELPDGSCSPGAHPETGRGCVADAVTQPAASGAAPVAAAPTVTASAIAPAPAPTLAATASAEPPVPASCPEGMRLVPSGKLRPGWEASAEADLSMVYEASIRGFCMDQSEVTVAAYGPCVAAGACPARSSVDALGVEQGWRELHDGFCNYGTARTAHPMNCVAFDDAAAFCRWAGKRLPSAEEWEYAARGSDGRPFPWGPEPPGPKRLNGCGKECAAPLRKLETEHHLGAPRSTQTMYPGSDGWLATAPVGSFPDGRSPFGLEDMAGNVAEWTASVAPPQSPSSDELGRIVRGGAWDLADASAGSPAHPGRGSALAPRARLDTVGFRCVR
jgi:formylglycine-generating enzyme required for sulfatase activity